jgi:hypothetical protein
MPVIEPGQPCTPAASPSAAPTAAATSPPASARQASGPARLAPTTVSAPPLERPPTKAREDLDLDLAVGRLVDGLAHCLEALNGDDLGLGGSEQTGHHQLDVGDVPAPEVRYVGGIDTKAPVQRHQARSDQRIVPFHPFGLRANRPYWQQVLHGERQRVPLGGESAKHRRVQEPLRVTVKLNQRLAHGP